MTEYSKMVKGKFTSTGGAQVINLPFQPDFVEMWNFTAMATPTNHGIPRAVWDVNMGQGFALVDIFNATPVLTTGRVLTNGITSFSGGLSFQFGPVYQHTGTTDFSITAANPAVVTTTTAHGLSSGDVVIFSNLYQTSTTGMEQIAGIPFTVTVSSTTAFSIPWDASGSNYTAFNTATATNNVGSFKKVLFPYLYFPGQAVIGAITTGTTTTVSTTNAHNFVVGQEVAFRVPATWGTTQLNSLPNATLPGSPIYGFVVSVTDYHTFVVNIDSSAFTAFVPNQTFAGFVGRTFAQVVAVGDVNTGGVVISAGSALYPPPNYTPIGTTNVNTINGPAIRGSYVTNTSQGFIIGVGNAKVGAAAADTSSFLVGNSSDVIFYRAFLHDLSSP